MTQPEADTRITYAELARLRAELAARPDAAEARAALGAALWWAGQRDEGLALLRSAAQAEPPSVAALTQLGLVEVALGEVAAAVEHLRAAARLAPEDASLPFAIGCAWLRADNIDAAIPCFEAAVALAPGHAGAWNNLGGAHRRQGRLQQARVCYQHAAAAAPGHAGVHGNLGSVLLALGRPQEAEAPLRLAVRLAPDDADACNNLAGALLMLDAPGEAAGWFRRALRYAPQHHQARFGLALALLTQGNFRDGWRHYESRWEDPAFTADERTFSAPRWHGETLPPGTTVLLHAEQGFGDTLQFVRYVPMLRARGLRVLLLAQTPLLSLLAPLADAVLSADATELPPFACHCPLLSLPLVFGTELATIPATVPYLHVPPARALSWRQRLGPRRRRRIGIAVSGDPAHPEDALRSIPATVFLRVFTGVDAEVHVLQTRLRPADAEALAGCHDHSALLGDFTDTAALAAEMDLIVSVDTALAHLAGALGLPVWVLLQKGADFRWLRQRADSPWYPTARLFRQSRAGEWQDVLTEVNAALRERFGPA
jgi:tetratricopeptide (TPR) repeat protein